MCGIISLTKKGDIWMKYLYVNDYSDLPKIHASQYDDYDAVFIKQRRTAPGCRSNSLTFDKKYSKNEGYSIIPLAWNGLIETLKPGDEVHTSSLLNIDSDMYLLLKKIIPLITDNIRIIAKYEYFDSNVGTDVTKLRNTIDFWRMLDKSITDETKYYQRKKRLSLDSENSLGEFKELYILYKRGNLTKTSFANKLHISRPTLDRKLAEFEKHFIFSNDKILRKEQ